MLRIIYCLAAMYVLTADAYAQEWVTTLKEDVFSGKNDATMIGGWSRRMSVYASCEGGKGIRLSVIMKDKSPELFNGIPAVLVIKVDGADARRFDANGYMHNETYGGFQIEEGAEGLLDTLMEIGGARRKILVGVQVPAVDVKDTEELRVGGSGRAVSTLLKTCAVS